ncbi:hypothetical protein Dda_5744 [Drechslerella dactyloides]|uniref:Uncharacterized protein n=1 Tax=Drechslerella dactyloides TaxID=74499 RepID=A0AAD6NHU8_DREDA|nr:hypothetical protein Dda_5744 [Drechslerella dactyloides]
MVTGDADLLSASKLRESLIATLQTKGDGVTRNRGFVILVTPSHANLVSDTDVIGEIIEEAVLSPGAGIQQVNGVAAVVDGLYGCAPSDGIEGWTAIVTDRMPLVYDSTGRSWWRHLRNKQNREASPNITPTEAGQPNETSRDPNDDRGELQLAFHLQGRKRKFANHSKILHDATSTVKLQLANTIFQTGRTATAAHYSYRIRNVAKDAPEIISSWNDKLTNVTVKLHPDQRFNAVISWPLRTLTSPRKIESSNGNIIKEISVPDAANPGTQKTVPASQELEAAVEKWLEEHPAYDPITLEKYPLEIYAGIVKAPERQGVIGDPQSALTTYRLDRIDCDMETRRRTRYRFAKVVSGGGRWGQGGLVALDPDGMQGFTVPGEGQLPEMTEPKSILRPNSWVEFFLADPSIYFGREKAGAMSGDFVFQSHRDMDQATRESAGEVNRRYYWYGASSKKDALEGDSSAKETPIEPIPGETALENASSEDVSKENVTEAVDSEAALEESVSKEDTPEKSPSETSTLESDPENLSSSIVSTKSASKDAMSKKATQSQATKQSHTTNGAFVNGSMWVDNQKADVPYTTITLTVRHQDQHSKDVTKRAEKAPGLQDNDKTIDLKKASKDYMDMKEVSRFMDFLKTIGVIDIPNTPISRPFHQKVAWFFAKWKEGVRSYVEPTTAPKVGREAKKRAAPRQWSRALGKGMYGRSGPNNRYIRQKDKSDEGKPTTDQAKQNPADSAGNAEARKEGGE